MDDDIDVPMSDRDDLLEDLLENDGEGRDFADDDNPTDDEANAGENETEGQTEGTTEDGTQKRPAKKRVVLNPRPKMNTERLCGKRGIPILPGIFENIKFKGKGHEKEDLNRMMSVMEHWGHRLFPIMTFDTLLGAIEKLGTKKTVQVCVKKMRMGMPILDEDFIVQRDDDEEMDQEHVVDDPSRSHVDEDVFDQLLRTQRTNERAHQKGSNSSSAVCPIPTTPTVTLTDEMRERMVTNKRLAMEKRQKMFQKLNLNNDDSEQAAKNNKPEEETTTCEKDLIIDIGLEASESTVLGKKVNNNSDKPQLEPHEVTCNNTDKVSTTELLDEDQLLNEMWGHTN